MTHSLPAVARHSWPVPGGRERSCVLSLATADDRYPRQLARLKGSVQAAAFAGELMVWEPGAFPDACPPHLDVPFAFKPFCFADARAAYDDLPEATRTRIDGLIGVHDFWEGRRRAGLKGEITAEMRRMIPFEPVGHPLVRSLPNGRKALYVGGHCIGVAGMDPDEGAALVEQLYAHATRERYVYRHQWHRHDLVIWDNRCTMHAATPLLSDAWRRDMRRTTINESGPETSAVEWMGLAAA